MKTKLTLQHSYLSLNIHKVLSCLGLIAISTAVAANQHSALTELQTESSQQVQQDITMPANLPPELQNAQKWQAFKILWQRLNTLAQPHDGTTPPDASQYIAVKSETLPHFSRAVLQGYTDRSYYQALSPEQAQLMHAQLREIFSESPISLEAQLLARLTELRIQEMSLTERHTNDHKLPDGYQMTRMMPPVLLTEVSPTLYMVNAIDRLQMRAQTLAELREKGAVSDKIYQRTLDALICDAQQVLFLDTLMTSKHLPDNAFKDDDFQVRLSLDAPPQQWGMSESPYLVGTIEPEDLVQPNTPEQIKKTDMQSLDVWDHAALSSYKRKLNIFAGDMLPEGEPPRMTAEQTQDALSELRQQLKELRAALVHIEPLIAELER